MNWRRSLLVLLIALLAVVVVFGLYLRELTSATEESGRELSATREQLERVNRSLQDAQAEIGRQRQERDRLEKELHNLQARLERQALLAEIPRVLEKVRGLRLHTPLRVRWVDRDFTHRFAQESIERQVPTATRDSYTATLVKLGLLPVGYSLTTALSGLFAEQAAGFYDPHTELLYMRSEMPAREFILSHEIGHALQDQSFSLRKILVDRPDDDDRSFAVHALIEGDATLMMQLYLGETISLWKAVELFADLFELLGMDQEKMEAAPLYIRETMTRMYLDGLSFVQTLRARGGWARVNAAFRDPPESSAQILHPEKYLLRVRPAPVTLPALEKTFPGWKPLHENTLGEIGVASLLGGAASSRKLAKEAAAGWAGDRLRSYRNGSGKVLVVWRTLWETPRDAGEFRDALTLLLDERYGRAVQAGHAWRPAAGAVVLASRDREVLFVDGATTPQEADSIAKMVGITNP
jgi:hypothetical protein